MRIFQRKKILSKLFAVFFAVSTSKDGAFAQDEHTWPLSPAGCIEKDLHCTCFTDKDLDELAGCINDNDAMQYEISQLKILLADSQTKAITDDRTMLWGIGLAVTFISGMVGYTMGKGK